MSRHRRQISLQSAIAMSVLTFVLGGAGAWLISTLLDKTLERVTRPDDLSVSESMVSLDGWVVSEKDYDRTRKGLPDVSYSNWASYMSGYSKALVLILDVWGRKDGGPVALESFRTYGVSCADLRDPVRLPTPGFGADYPIRRVEVTIDADGPTNVLPVAGEDWTFPLQVSEVEAERFLLKIVAPSNLACTFRLQWTYTANGETKRQLFPATDEPALRVAGDFAEGEDVPLESILSATPATS